MKVLNPAPAKKRSRPTASHDNGDARASRDSLDRRMLLAALHAAADGDFSVRLPDHWTGLDGKISDRFNEIVASNQQMAQELARVGEVVGKQGKTQQRVRFPRAIAAWGEMQVSVNMLIDDLVRPTTEVTRAVTAVAQGNLLETMRLDVEGRPLEGEFLRSATIVNTMIKQLGVFTSEVTRVAREVGTDGKLGGQAQVPEVSGVWKDLTESVNLMASNLTAQVRNISDVTIAVASGDLSRKITVDVRGEILQLKEAINTMVDQLRSFASEVTRVAREVGTDGRLGGQAVVPGVAGTWKDLVTLVQQLALMHGGTVHADSAGPGLGTEFSVLLPVVAEAGHADSVAPQALRARQGTPRRILVVDDNRDAVESLAELLRIDGSEVEIAFDGEAAIKSASTFQPDIVLLDIGMPIVDGYTAARAIRRESNGRGPLLVAMTGWGQSEDKRRAVEAGFDAHLVKPVGIDSLLDLLSSLQVMRPAS